MCQYNYTMRIGPVTSGYLCLVNELNMIYMNCTNPGSDATLSEQEESQCGNQVLVFCTNYYPATDCHFIRL